MAELDTKLAEAYSQGQPWSELGREHEQVLQAKESIDFVDRAMLLMEGGLSPKIATAVADREVLEYIQRNVNVYEEGYKEAVAKHETNCMELIDTIEAVLVWAFPELQGSARDVNAVIRAVGQRNPARAVDIQNGVRLFELAAEKGLQARQRHEHEKAQRFQTWACNQDNIFRSQNPEFFSPRQQQEVAHEAFEYLESKGISKEETVKLHESNELFRSAAGQSVLLDAMRYQKMMKTKEGIRDKRYVAPVQVLKPGVADSGIGREPERMPSSFHGNSGLREAASILNNRRAKRR